MQKCFQLVFIWPFNVLALLAVLFVLIKTVRCTYSRTMTNPMCLFCDLVFDHCPPNWPVYPHSFNRCDQCEKIFDYENSLTIGKNLLLVMCLLFDSLLVFCGLCFFIARSQLTNNLPLWLTVHGVHCNIAPHSIMNNALQGKYSWLCKLAALFGWG